MKGPWMAGFSIAAALLLLCAWLVPSHFLAVDSAVVARAGQGAPGATLPTLVEEGLTLLSVEKLGPAQMLWRVAQTESVPRHEQLGGGIAQFSRDNAALAALGGASPLLEKVEAARGAAAAPQPIIDLLTKRAFRESILNLLRTSRRPGVQQILKNRELTNTVHFPAASTSAGQALDAAVVTAALLYQGDSFTTSFRDAFEWLAMRANRGDESGSLELVYLDLLSLGRRLDWVSLTEVIKSVPDIATLRDLAESFRVHEDSVANISSAILLSGNAAGVSKYLMKYSETGLNDLNFALRSGRGAVELLVERQQRIYYAGLRGKLAGYDPFGAFLLSMIPMAKASQMASLFVKYLLLFGSAYCLARALAAITRALGLHLGTRFMADLVVASAVTFVSALLLEPFLGSVNQEYQFPIRLQLPSLVGAATASQIHNLTRPYMKEFSLISLLIFFLVQALIYVWCLTKLAEIRRQSLPPRMKLKLLENEDHLFDAGLYVGFVGSVISLILMSLGVGKVSMMAYASTSFGIIFVSVLKIFHVRPLRRQLILESDAQS